MSIVGLPNELLAKGLIKLPFLSLVNLAQTNSEINNLCNDEYLWEKKSRLELSSLLFAKLIDQSWKSFYLRVMKYNRIPAVSLLGKRCITKYVLIEPTYTLKEESEYVIASFKLLPNNLIIVYTDVYEKLTGLIYIDNIGKYNEILNKEWQSETRYMLIMNSNVFNNLIRSITDDTQLTIKLCKTMMSTMMGLLEKSGVKLKIPIF